MRFFILFINILIALGCADPDAAGPAPGFDRADFAADTRPQDDFYGYVNGPWLARTAIPAEYSSYGAARILQETNETRLRALVDGLAALPERKAGSDEQKIVDLYQSYLDEQRAEALGLTPLADEFAAIAAIDSYDALIEWFGRALVAGIEIPVNFYVDADAADPERNLAYLWQDGLGLPDRDYWLDDAEQLAAVRDEYAGHIERMFRLAGWVGGTQAAADIAALERRIAEAHWSSVQNRDRQKIYSSKFSIDEAAALGNGFDWPAFLGAAGFGAPDVVVIAQTDYFAELGDIVRATSLDVWRTYARFRTLKSFAPYLSRDIVLEDFDFEERALRGTEQIRPRWKLGIYLVDGGIGELLGKAYVDRHFPPAAKARVEQIVANLREAFRQSIDSLDWMSDATRASARRKLASFNAKIGYPDVWRDYSGLDIVAGDLVGNIRRVRQFEHRRQIAKLSKPVDRTEWGMTPQTINAYYRPTWNEIVFPAAILQPPFFDFTVDDAINYGAIGSVIGHEFSHGFDDQGRKFDGDGRLEDWWTAADAEQYEKRSSGLIRQFDAIEPLPGHSINGALTLGENIADLAGVTIAYRAWEILLGGEEAPPINGFTGPQRFFIGYALGWRTKLRDEYLLQRLLSDPHSPPRYRVNAILRNLPEFHAAFGVGVGDGMHLPDDELVAIW